MDVLQVDGKLRTELKIKDGDMALTVDNLIHNHEALREQMQLLKRSAEKWELNIELCRDKTSSNCLKNTVEKQFSFVQAIGHLKYGLKSLQTQEEEVISKVNNLALKPIRSIHAEITKQIDRIDSLLINLKPDQLIVCRELLMKSIRDLCELVAEHSLNEDKILQTPVNRPGLRTRILQPA
jgi:hypothetical protein